MTRRYGNMMLTEAEPAGYVRNTDPEWARMWAALASSLGYSAEQTHPPDLECCPTCREDWQYMGTWKKGAETYHQFRHRCRPMAPPPGDDVRARKYTDGHGGWRTLANVAVSAQWFQERTA